MKSIIHAERSAKMFGGSPKAYLPIHELIDWQKLTVTADVKGRFFLHHIDIGLPIVESIFGKEIKVTKKITVSVKKVFLQHLFEDFGGIVTFKDHWLKASSEMASHFERTQASSRRGPGLKEVIQKIQKGYPKLLANKQYAKELDRLFSIINLTAFTTDEAILNHLNAGMIFDHPLGFSLAQRVFGKEKIGPYAIHDLLESATSAVLLGTINDFGHYFKKVGERYWMLAPAEKDRLSTTKVLKLIDNYEKGKDCSVEKLRKKPKPKTYPSSDSFEYRKHCNID